MTQLRNPSRTASSQSLQELEAHKQHCPSTGLGRHCVVAHMSGACPCDTCLVSQMATPALSSGSPINAEDFDCIVCMGLLLDPVVVRALIMNPIETNHECTNSKCKASDPVAVESADEQASRWLTGHQLSIASAIKKRAASCDHIMTCPAMSCSPLIFPKDDWISSVHSHAVAVKQPTKHARPLGPFTCMPRYGGHGDHAV